MALEILDGTIEVAALLACVPVASGGSSDQE
jgi:hypothetical protein